MKGRLGRMANEERKGEIIFEVKKRKKVEFNHLGFNLSTLI